jgi:LuxR family maltose regulon positive regulatory protein
MSILHLETKLHIPPVRPEYIPRSRLVTSLQEGLQRKLTLLSAPAGFGKTTLLAGWINQNHIPAGWLSLDEGENELPHFLSYLIAAVQSVIPEAGADASDILTLRHQTTHHQVLSILINDLLTVKCHFALVLDDYHLIDAGQVHEAMQYLLDHLPGCLHIFITTRADPPLPLSLLRGRGEMIELRVKQLRFNQQETSEFIHKYAGLHLSDSSVNTLVQLTEGWITGIQMAVISIKDEGDVAAFLRDFSGSNRYILDYLVEEVLDRQPKVVQDFLCASSILDRMTGPLCDALVIEGADDPDSIVFKPGKGEQILKELERDNLFIMPLDETRRWYRYHHLFADLLKQRLNNLYPELVPQLHLRAAAWHKNQGMISEAIRHTLAGKDYDTAAGMITDIADEVLMHSHFIRLRNWIGQLPEDVVAQNPLLQVYFTFTSLYSDLPAHEAIEQLDKLKQMDSTGQLKGYILALEALISAFRLDIQHSAELSMKAIELLPEDRTFFRSAMSAYLGFAYQIAGNMTAAKVTLEDSVRISSKAGNLTMQIFALSHLAEISLLEARFDDAASFSRRMFDLGLDQNGSPRPVVGLAHIILGIVQRERGNFDQAMTTLSEGVELVERVTPMGAVRGYVNLAWLHHFCGDETSADRAIETAARLASQFEHMREAVEYVHYNNAKLSVARGEPLQALGQLGIDLNNLSSEIDRMLKIRNANFMDQSSELIHYIGIAEAFFALEKFEVAKHLFQLTLESAQNMGWRRVELAIKIYLAEIQFLCGSPDQAAKLLEPVFKIAVQQEIVLDLLERGTRLIPLLRRVLDAGIEPEFTAKIMARIGAQDAQQSHLLNASLDQYIYGPLSQREKTILQYMQTHLTTREIANELSISVHTVRTHVKNIYKKLQVNSRAEAVARMKELNIQ